MEQLLRLEPATLKGLLKLLDGALSRPGEEFVCSIKELSPVGLRLMEGIGFQMVPGTGELRLPAGANVEAVREARKDLALLHRQAELRDEGAAAAAGAGPLQHAPAAAMALQLAAASVSPTVNMPSLLADHGGREDGLTAAEPWMLPKPKPGAGKEQPPNPHRQVPNAVLNAAAAVGQAVYSQGGLPAVLLGSQGDGALNSALSATAATLAAGQLAAPRTSKKAPAGGASRWLTAPQGVAPESHLVVTLPESEFTYIERPWSHFVTRWAAIDTELLHQFNDKPFTMLDLGSCCGFFSLQASAGYGQAVVVGVEGSVGIGNGTTGVGGNEDQIIATKAIQTHLRWVDKLYLPNCFLAPEVWDYRRVCQLSALGRPICDAMLELSVVHHIDNISTDQYAAAGLSHLEGTLSLMVKLLDLAPRHFVELPATPWIEHVYNAYGTAKAFLEAVVKASPRQWVFVGPLCVSEWYGTRELWLLEEDGPMRKALPTSGLRGLFPRLLGVSKDAVPPPGAAAAPQQPSQQPEAEPQPSAPAPITLAQPREAQRQPAAPAQPQPAGLPATGGRLSPAELGAALLAAPTALIAAHVQLRDALAGADGALQYARQLK